MGNQTPLAADFGAAPTIKGVGGAALLAFLFVAELIVGALGAYWMGWWSP